MSDAEWDAALAEWDAAEAELDARASAAAAAAGATDTAAAAAAAAEPPGKYGLDTAPQVRGGGDSGDRVRAEAARRRKARRAACGQQLQQVSDWAQLLRVGPAAGAAAFEADGVTLLRTVANFGLPKGGKAGVLLHPLEPSGTPEGSKAKISAAAAQRGGGPAQHGVVQIWRGFAVRALEPVLPLLSHSAVGKVMELLARGGDLHRANKLLRHDDVTTVRSLIAGWFVANELAVPAAYAADALRQAALSPSSATRLQLRRADPLQGPLLLEGCGCHALTGAPLCPPSWLGRRFADGAALHAALCALAADTTDPQRATGAAADGPRQQHARRGAEDGPGEVCSHELRLLEEDEWLSAAAAGRLLAAQSDSPVAVVRVRNRAAAVGGDEGAVDVSFEAYDPAMMSSGGPAGGTNDCAAADALGGGCRQVGGGASRDVAAAAGGAWLHRVIVGAVVGLAPTVVLAVDRGLLQHLADAEVEQQQQEQQQQQAASADEVDDVLLAPERATGTAESGGGCCLFASRQGAAAQAVLAPAALLQVCIRRGAGLCTAAPLRKACETLLRAGPSHPIPELGYLRTSGVRHLLCRLLSTTFQDVCPFLPGRGYCSVPELLGLAVLAHADHEWAPTASLASRIVATAERLHGFDGPGCAWPWRGWKRLLAAPAAVVAFEGDGARHHASATSAICDALRAGLCVLPMLVAEQQVLRRHLGALLLGGVDGGDGEWARKLRPLPEAGNRVELTAGAALDNEAALASVDHNTRPSVLLWVQASMPMPPREESQHSLPALAELVHRLSSATNVRSVRQRLIGSMGAEDELARITSFVDVAPAATSQQQPAPARMGLDGYDPMAAGAGGAAEPEGGWQSATATMHLTAHERRMLGTIQSVQRHLAASDAGDATGLPAAPSADEPTAVGDARPAAEARSAAECGRAPTAYESRTAFLQLFGRRHTFSLPGGAAVAVTLAGDADSPCLVQSLSAADGKGGTGGGGPHSFLEDGPAVEAATDELVRHYAGGRRVDCPTPPPGFQWKTGIGPTAVVGVLREPAPAGGGQQRRRLSFSVGGVALEPFDATAALRPANAPPAVQIKHWPTRVRGLLEQCLYIGGGESGSAGIGYHGEDEFAEDPIGLLLAMEREALRLRLAGASMFDPVLDWAVLAAAGCPLRPSFWRDLAVKLLTREGSSLAVAPVGRDGRRTGGQGTAGAQPMTEGVMLRVLTGLQLAYPALLIRASELRFELVAPDSPQLVHLTRSLSLLAFGCYEDGPRFVGGLAPKPEPPRPAAPGNTTALPAVTTKLWPHQLETARRVMAGVESGMRGFADASAVGAGKTLSALAVCCAVAEWADAAGLQRHGFLVLVPTTSLLQEWETQALLHTTGLRILTQAANGEVVLRGRSAGGHAAAGLVAGRTSRQNSTIGPDCLVLSTLARARDKPFVTQPAWDFVVVDECLSVQNDSALQTMEAWRQVSASRCGVLMLSATFFRSSFRKLFYMIRMLRSPLPKTEDFLGSLLREHIVVHVPENRRAWSLTFQPVELGPEQLLAYQRLIHSATAHDHRSLWVSLKAHLRSHYERTTAVAAFVAEARRLLGLGRRPLLFANSDAEAGRVLAGLAAAGVPAGMVDGRAPPPPHPGPPPPKRPKQRAARAVLVGTVGRHSHGLNLQGVADAIVARPQSGDLIEQMKGRVDRPGQAKNKLLLTVLYAAGTLEEAEAANIRLCGAFFRQWLDPLSSTFQERAIAASIAAARRALPAGAAASAPQRRPRASGAVAAAFQLQLRNGGGGGVGGGGGSGRPQDAAAHAQSVNVVRSDDAEASAMPEVAAAAAADGELSRPVVAWRSADTAGASGGGVGGSSGKPKKAKRTKKAPAMVRNGLTFLPRRGAGSSPGQNLQGQMRKRSRGGRDDADGPPESDDTDDNVRNGLADHTDDSALPPQAAAAAADGEKPSQVKKRQTKTLRPEARPRAPEGLPREPGPALVVLPPPAELEARPAAARLDAAELEAAVAHLRRADGRLGGVIAAIGHPTAMLAQMGGASDCFRALSKSIVYQQLSVKVAAIIFGRLIELCGGEAAFTPDKALALSDDDLRHRCGFSYRKASYMKNLAAAFVSGQLSDGALSKMTDEEVVAAVTAVKGIGEWSAHMFMMFSLGRADVFPWGDLAIRKAMKRLYSLDDELTHQTAVHELPSPAAIKAIAQAWRPYRTVGSWYMWHVVETKEAFYTFG